ncbi:MAG: 3-oxoadipate enol-lactonase [Duganella sp.]
MNIMQCNGAALRYQIDGKPGRPWLLFANSLGTDLHMWDAQAQWFGAHYRVLRYDTRGHGGSSAPAGPCTLDQLGADALALLDALAIDRAHVCGLSMGGMVAQWLAVHAPQRVATLTLANTAPRIGTAHGWRDRAAQVRAAGMDGVADGAAARWFTPAWTAHNPHTARALVQGLRGADAEGYAACCEALAMADLTAAIAVIAAPTLIVAGRHDAVTTVADAEAMAQAIAGARVVVLDAAHISNIEAEHAFNLALRDFLRA